MRILFINAKVTTFSSTSECIESKQPHCTTLIGSKLFGKERQAQAGADINCLCSRNRFEIKFKKKVIVN